MKLHHFIFQIMCVILFLNCEKRQQHWLKTDENFILQENFRPLDTYLYDDMTPLDIRCFDLEIDIVRLVVVKRFGGSYSMIVARDIVDNPKGRALYKIQTVLPSEKGTVSFSQIIDVEKSPSINSNWQSVTKYLKTSTIQLLNNEEFKRHLGSEHYGIIEYRLGGEYFKKVISFGLPPNKIIQELETKLQNMCPGIEELELILESLKNDTLGDSK
ncbi:MAG TPA: hypothetical protein PKA70_18810 [Saprospiraceae bacterium]|nr:hypothetical protein [Saprospiraceae bacterium]